MNMFTVFLRKPFLCAAIICCMEACIAKGTRPIVTAICAKPYSQTKILVSWTLPQASEDLSIDSLLLYRSLRPIASASDIQAMAPIASLPAGTSTYQDSVSDYREYYYAVISMTRTGYHEQTDLFYDEELDIKPESGPQTAYIVVLPGVNATVDGTRAKSPVAEIQGTETLSESAKEKLYNKDELREQPLPLIDILSAEEKHKSVISKNAELSALALVGGKQTHAKQPLLEPYIFEADLVSPTGGDEYLLFEVLRTTFIQKNYIASISALKRFLAQNRSKAVTDRANFYLGEAYYFSGRYKYALEQFLYLEDTYAPLSRRWIESTIEHYDIPIHDER